MFLPKHPSDSVQEALHQIFCDEMWSWDIEWVSFVDSTNYCLFVYKLGTFIRMEQSVLSDWNDSEKEAKICTPRAGTKIFFAIEDFCHCVKSHCDTNPDYKCLLVIKYKKDCVCRILSGKYMPEESGNTKSLFEKLGVLNVASSTKKGTQKQT